MVNPCIYKITNPNNKIYIGQTINFNRRINTYKNFNKIFHQKKLVNSFKKYGFDSHKIEVLINCKAEELNFWEEFYINLFDSFKSDYGLNSTSGGYIPKNKLSTPLTSEWKEKISKAHIGRKREAFTKEWKENISKSAKKIIKNETWINNLKEAAIIRKNNGGYIIKEEQKEKFKKSYSIFLKSEKGIEFKNNISQNTKKLFSKPVLQYTMDMVFIKKWDSIREAARNLGVAHNNLVNCTNNKSKSASGFIWKKEQELMKN